MRQAFISQEDAYKPEEGETLTDRYPWAAIIEKVDGGYMAWESVDDYRVWSNQQ